MALGKMQQMAIKQMTREAIDAMGDSPKEIEVKEYWYSVHAEDIKLAETPNIVNFEKLNAFVQTPRATSTDFIRDCAGKLPMFGKDKVLNALASAPLVYGAVVQAHHALYKSGNYQNLACVVIVSLNNDHMRNVEYLRRVADYIYELRDAQTIPEDMQAIVKELRKETGYFNHKVPESVAYDNETWCATFTIENQNVLPMNRISDDKIIPFLLKETPIENQFIQLAIIPQKYYSG